MISLVVVTVVVIAPAKHMMRFASEHTQNHLEVYFDKHLLVQFIRSTLVELQPASTPSYTSKSCF